MKRVADIYGGVDPRDLPAYTLSEAAQLLGVALSTLRNWTQGREFSTREGRRTSAAVISTPLPGFLSFTNLVEAHVLASLRHRRVKLERIRAAVHYVEKHFRLKHALALKFFKTDGVSLFIEQLTRDGKRSTLLNASQNGQTGLRAVLDEHLKRVEYEGERAVRFFPLLRRAAPQSIVVDARRAFGRPVLDGTSVPISDIASRFHSGDKVEVLASDYEVTTDQIEEAIRATPAKAA